MAAAAGTDRRARKSQKQMNPTEITAVHPAPSERAESWSSPMAVSPVIRTRMPWAASRPRVRAISRIASAARLPGWTEP